MRSRFSWFSLLGFAGAVAGAAWFGSRYTPAQPETGRWYRQLRKPPFNPPDALFAPVWTALYILIAISGWRISQAEPSSQRDRALALWTAQLLLNAEWTVLFFGKRDPAASLADVILLEAVILDYIQCARSVDPAAAACFVPYSAWVGFATVLNEEIVRRNR